jgi:integrase
MPGLVLRVYPSGAKTFLVRKSVDGKQERVRLGNYPQVTVEHARRMAAKTNGAIAEGRNPNAEKRALSSEITLSELFRRYLSQHAKPHKKSWREDEAQYKRYLRHWRNRRLSSITSSDVSTLHTRLGAKNGHYAANRLLALVSVLFSRAADWGWQGGNPAARIKKFKERSRDRFLDAHELARFFKALNEEPNETVRDFFLVALLTGARRSKVLQMRWEQINLETATWKIPDTKSGDAYTVPLVPKAIEILKGREAQAAARRDCRDEEKPWVFPGRGHSGHMVEPSKAWNRIRARAGLKDVRIHDLRRTLGSWQAAGGTSLPIIGKGLGHKSLASTGVYTRLNLDPVRESMEMATKAMLETRVVPSTGPNASFGGEEPG